MGNHENHLVNILITNVYEIRKQAHLKLFHSKIINNFGSVQFVTQDFTVFL